jgi:hypothetical protein
MLNPKDTTTLVFRVDRLEQDVKRISGQLADYEVKSESSLKLGSIQMQLADIKKDVGDVAGEVKKVNEKATNSEKAFFRLQIIALTSILGGVFTIVSGVLIALFTHALH